MMTFGQDLDAMYEARCAREWEEQNAEPKVPAYQIVSQLQYAWDSLSEAVNDRLAEACDMAEGTPAEYKIQSMIDALEGIQNEIKKVQKEVEAL